MFPVFLKTCEWNKEFNWLLFTDNKETYNYPDNVKVVEMTFEEMKSILKRKFDFQISLEEPHKLCDYKPAYGYIFEDYLSEYKFWGHCDIDTIMGNLSRFITDELLDKYDKLFCLGHMVLYRNTLQNNRVFMSDFRGKSLYRDSFSDSKTTVFDETFRSENNINTIFIDQGLRVLQEDWSVNFKIQPTRFIKITYNYRTGNYDEEYRKDELYVWSNGNVYRYYVENGSLLREEFLYMHLQLRRMKYHESILVSREFKIVPESFLPLETWPITIKSFNIIKKKTWNYHFINMKRHNLKDKYKRYKERLRMYVERLK
ncbi:hypothetical protein SAMN05443253_107298 [Bacillus sp. OK048]|nr:DUF6625 family protein [Bacillus sp. OK048]SDN05501.1 hypothetical protein SAMN05443253_107298 [Bacillus sp. OK048]